MGDVVLHPMIAHVHVFGESPLDVFICKLCTVFVVCFDWGCRFLWVAHLFEASSHVDADLPIVECSGDFRFC